MSYDAGALRAKISEAVGDHRVAILDLLREMVACNSYVHNKPGVDAVGAMVARAMPPCFAHEVVSQTDVGNHHIYTHAGDGARPVVMAGHLDTICPPDPSFTEAVDEGGLLRGPGTNDMKGGDVVILWSLRVLDMLGLLADLPVVCIFNGDEEVGSPTSNPIFRSMRDRAAVGLVYEGGSPPGTVVTTRKGIQRYRLDITGKACHFGNLKERKISAVEEMARKTLAVEAINRGGLAANVGRAEGGLLANCVADHASMDFELRYWDPALEDEVRESVARLAESPHVAGCELELTRLSHRPAMQPTPEARTLFDLVVDLGARLEQPITEEKRGGVSDACWLSHVGVPTVDGLGPLGADDHTRNEYIITETLFDRIELTVHLLLAVREAGWLEERE